MTIWRKLWRWLLPISLAINVFFVVVALRHRPFMHPRPPDPGSIVAYLKSNLPAADQAILEKSFAEHFNGAIDPRRAHADFTNRLRAVLTTTPFDGDALKQVLMDGRAERLAMEDALLATILDAVTKISPEGRAKLADRALDHPPGGDGPGDHHHRGPSLPN